MDQYNGGFDFNNGDLSIDDPSEPAIDGLGVSSISVQARGKSRSASLTHSDSSDSNAGDIDSDRDQQHSSHDRPKEETGTVDSGNFAAGDSAELRNPFDRYCAELRRLEKLDAKEELKLQERLAETGEGLIRAIANIPECARLIVNQSQINGLAPGDLSSDDSDEVCSDEVNQADDAASRVRDESDDFGNQITKAELMQNIADSESIEKLNSILEDLFQAAREHGAMHEVTLLYREALARAVVKCSLGPPLLKYLVGHLEMVFERNRLPDQCKQADNGGQGLPETQFEQHYGQSFEEFESFATEASRLYLEWEATRNRISECHVGLVVFLARQYSSDPQELIDLIQEGNIGLLKAVERYNYRLGFRFSTYATYWIRLAMSRYIARSSRAVRLPYRQNLHLGSVRKKREHFKQIYGRLPSTLELARETGISEANLLKLDTMSQAIASLDAQLEVGENLDLMSMMEQETFRAPADLVEKQNLSGIIEKSIGRLNQREAYVIRQRFGIGVYAEKTLQELGSVLGLTRERVRQIENGALKKLRADLALLAG